MSDHQKSEHCEKCCVHLDVTGDKQHTVLDACYEFRRRHSHETIAWICYHHDMGIHVNAIFDNELDALRHAVGSGYLNVAAVEPGEIGGLP